MTAFTTTLCMEKAGVTDQKNLNPIISTFTRLFWLLKKALTKELIRFNQFAYGDKIKLIKIAYEVDYIYFLTHTLLQNNQLSALILLFLSGNTNLFLILLEIQYLFDL